MQASRVRRAGAYVASQHSHNPVQLLQPLLARTGRCRWSAVKETMLQQPQVLLRLVHHTLPWQCRFFRGICSKCWPTWVRTRLQMPSRLACWPGLLVPVVLAAHAFHFWKLSMKCALGQYRRPSALQDPSRVLILTSVLEGVILSLPENNHILKSKASSCAHATRLWHTHCHPKFLKPPNNGNYVPGARHRRSPHSHSEVQRRFSHSGKGKVSNSPAARRAMAHQQSCRPSLTWPRSCEPATRRSVIARYSHAP